MMSGGQRPVRDQSRFATNIDLFIAERLSGIYRNRCPGIGGNAVPDLVKSLSGI